MKKPIVDLDRLLKYYDKLLKAIDRLYPDEITWENVDQYNFDLNLSHPNWVNAHFPVLLIYYRPVAGKLRKAKKISTMYQNHNNVATQLVWTANDFGGYKRKNKHKGFSEIVAAVSGNKDDFVGFYTDRQPLKKFKNFIELADLYAPGVLEIRALCEVLEKNYPCNSTGQLRML